MLRLRSNDKRRRTWGFTLMETLVVIVLITSLAGLIFPTFVQAKRRAKDVVCISNLRSCFTAAMIYASDYDDRWPLGKDCADLRRPDAWPLHIQPQIKAMPLLSLQLEPYGANKGVWECPLDTGLQVLDAQPTVTYLAVPSLYADCGMSYAYNTSVGMAGVPFTAFPDPTKMMYLRDQAGHWHPGAEPLPEGVYPGPTSPWTQYFKYTIVFVDGHAKRVGYKETWDAFTGGM